MTEKCKIVRRNVYNVSVHLEKAFNSEWVELWNVLYDQGVNSWLLNAVRVMWDGNQT